ncbi:Flavin reductase like domain protein [Marinomonas aquimarina]|uniref:Flavin reductase like domain protein n=1 Tax=Marinomonas aquimarina TaxID=295068 RepID=A0A1A8TF43_9GAMM|nr:flavin reductase family protein [Marinomonas aquimarina]SBS30487.1 Flavin reductase like domain protein [Marinomonas aquimarina]
MNIAAESLTTPEIYRLLVGGVTPRPIAWISTVSESGVHNLAPYSFFSVVSVNPPVLSYTQVNPQTGQDKDTLKNLMATKECVVHIVDSAALEKMNLTCANLPSEQSEFDVADIASESSQSVAPLSVVAAPVRYECRLREVVRIGEQPGNGSLVLLDVVSVYVADHLYQDGAINQHALDSVGKMGGDFYSFTKALEAIARP